MKQNPIAVFSWRKPFLSALKRYLMELTGGEPGKAAIITPNHRPARYLAHLLASEKKGMILPRMLTISDMAAMWRASSAEAPLRVANLLDQAALLHECVRMEADSNSLLAKYFGEMDMAAFLPWAIRLAGVLEDYNMAGRPLEDIKNLAGEVSEPAETLLSALKSIGNSFTGLLQERNWTTNGHDHLLAYAHINEIPRLLQPGSERPVLIAGFYKPEPIQDKLLKKLWREGAKVCLHTDPALALGGKMHPAAEWHRKWQANWEAASFLYGADDAEDSVPIAQERSFFAGYDLHSQLEEIDRLARTDCEKSTAIILGKSDALLAVLQNLPPANVNVSMGYPLERAPLFNLLEDLLAAGRHRKEGNIYRAVDILEIVRHPFLSMAGIDEGEEKSLFHPLQALDYSIRARGRYWRAEESIVAGHGLSPHEAADAELARREVAYLANLFAQPTTLAEMADSMRKLADWLKSHCGPKWAFNNPLDAEALYRMENEIVPALANNLLASRNFDLSALGDIALKIVKEQRIPFEADPIEGLQVMGLLESRLLHFDRVIFVDATDDVLPGTYAQDALLPDSLRAILGLPDNSSRQEQAAHNMHRLLASAGEAHFLWQESKSKSSSAEGKKIRSRFMEQLIWEKEKEKPALVKADRSIVKRPVPRLQAAIRKPQPISRSVNLTEAIDRFWQKPVSVTWLDAYLACPSQFIYSHILGLDRHDKARGNIHALVGSFAHRLLKMLYEPVPHEEIREANDAEAFRKRVRTCFEELARKEMLEEKIPVVSFLDLEATIPERLSEYRSGQPEQALVVALEEKLDNDLEINGKKVFFKGTCDRIDQRGGKLFVTDFKTGRPPLNNAQLWENEEFFQKVEAACDQNDFAALDELFAEFRNDSQSVQLALYLLLLVKSHFAQKWGDPANAFWVPLTRGADEIAIFETDLANNDDPRLKHCRIAIELIEAHMRLAPSFDPEKESREDCKYCDFSGLCRR